MVRKIYIDSRFRDSGTNSNFQFTLPAPVLHPKSRAYIDSIHIPNVFYTINNLNKHIYLEEIYIDAFGVNPTGNTLTRKRKIALDEGFYDLQTLATQLATALQRNSFFPGAVPTNPTDYYTVTTRPDQGKLIIGIVGTGTNSVKVWPKDYLRANKDLWVDANSNQVGTYVEHDDCYTAIGLEGDVKFHIFPAFPLYTNRHISILPFHTLYLTCDYGLGTNEDCISARGGSILRSIPIATSFGNMIHDQLQNPFDYIELEAGQLRSFSFALRDVFQREIPLLHPFSFSILLVEED